MIVCKNWDVEFRKEKREYTPRELVTIYGLQTEIQLSREELPKYLISHIEQLEYRISELEKQVSLSERYFVVISEEAAEKIISNFIKERKTGGIKSVNIIDLIESTRLPAEQIERIMKKLTSKGIKELNA